MIGCAAVGLALIVAGVFVALWLALIGSLIFISGPLGFALCDAVRHPPRPPDERHDPTGDYLQSAIERAPTTAVRPE